MPPHIVKFSNPIVPMGIQMVNVSSAVQISSSCLLSKKLKVKTYKTIILYGCETWSLTLRDEHRLKVFKNKVLRKYLGLRKTKLQANEKSYTMLSYMHCILRLT